jgi:hypothetical protein
MDTKYYFASEIEKLFVWLKFSSDMSLIEGQIEVTRRRGRRRKKEEALDRIKWRNHFGRGFGPASDRLLMMMSLTNLTKTKT